MADIPSHSSHDCERAIGAVEQVRYARGEYWANSGGLDNAYHSGREYKAQLALTATHRIAAWRANDPPGSHPALASRVHGGVRTER